MAQIITNTFFDDCEGIVNIGGRPVWEIRYNTDSEMPREETLRERAKRFGLSERVAKDLSLLCGITCHVATYSDGGLATDEWGPVCAAGAGFEGGGALMLGYSTPPFADTDVAVEVTFQCLVGIKADYFNTPEDERLDLMCL